MYNNIVLIMPNFNWRVDFDTQKDLPMGLLYIAAVLEKNGYEVSVIDANAENLSIHQVVDRVAEKKALFVGISANYSPLNNLAKDLSEEIKKLNSEILIGVGGNHATASDKFMLKNSNGSIDFILKGQGEKVFPLLLHALNHNIDLSFVKGISYIKENQIISNSDTEYVENLDELPLPAYHLVNMGLYDRYNIVSSRGCPFKCNYCASGVICKKVFYRSPENIVSEIEFLANTYGEERFFWFSDDTFTSNIKHTNKLLDIMIERNLNIKWSCLTRVNKTNIEILEKMKKAGCKYVSYGVESGDIDMIEKMNKKITLKEVKNALEMTKKAELDMYTFFLIGYPGETKSSVMKGFDLIRETKPSGASFSVVIPLPGTGLWKYLEENGFIDFEMIKWDYLFAKSGNSKYENYSASLASSWCNLSQRELISLCEEGQKLTLG